MHPTPISIAQLVRDSKNGQKEALDQLIPLVYEQLRAIAGRQLNAENPGHTLRPTALVHEVYLRLVDADISFEGRGHFCAIAARLVRRILLDHAKARNRGKRWGGAARVSFDEGTLTAVETSDTVVAINEALDRLTTLDPRKAEIIELVFFGGLEQDLAATELHISPATLRRELRLAKAWLYNELRPAEN